MKHLKLNPDNLSKDSTLLFWGISVVIVGLSAISDLIPSVAFPIILFVSGCSLLFESLMETKGKRIDVKDLFTSKRPIDTAGLLVGIAALMSMVGLVMGFGQISQLFLANRGLLFGAIFFILLIEGFKKRG